MLQDEFMIHPSIPTNCKPLLLLKISECSLTRILAILSIFMIAPAVQNSTFT